MMKKWVNIKTHNIICCCVSQNTIVIGIKCVHGSCHRHAS